MTADSDRNDWTGVIADWRLSEDNVRSAASLGQTVRVPEEWRAMIS